MTKKIELIVIISLSVLLTTIGLLVDSDPKNESAWTTVIEYFAMFTIILAITSILYYGSTFILRRIRKSISKL